MQVPERRKFIRELRSARIRMVKVGSHRQLSARCTNVSIAGMCLEIDVKEPLEAGDSYDMSVDFDEKEQEVHLIGRVIWCTPLCTQREGLSVYRAGIQFKI